MAEKLYVELQDDEGNVYYLYTSSSTVFCEDGKSVQEKIGTVKGRITTKENLKLVTEANYLPEAKAVKEYFDELTGKLGYTANVTTVTLNGWTVQWQNAGAGYIYVRLTRTVRKLEGGSAYTEITNLPFTVAFLQCIPITNIVATTVVGSGIANFFGTTLICRYQPYGNEVSNVITGLLRVV